MAEEKNSVYVVGHRNPDTDSICAAIAYANLKCRITGLSYAYFSANFQGSGNDVEVETANLGTITYVDGPEIDASNINLDWETTKEFTITSDNQMTVSSVDYQIDMEVTLKYFKKMNGTIMLIPENNEYENILITENNPIKILGIAIEIWKPARRKVWRS